MLKALAWVQYRKSFNGLLFSLVYIHLYGRKIITSIHLHAYKSNRNQMFKENKSCLRKYDFIIVHFEHNHLKSL